MGSCSVSLRIVSDYVYETLFIKYMLNRFKRMICAV